MKVIKLIGVVMLLTIPLMGCNNADIEKWMLWYEQSPQEAIDFANLPAVQEALTSRGSRENNSNKLRHRRGDVWDRIAECESGQTWSYNGGSGYDGGLQFLPSTWRSYGGRDFAEFAYQATREQQITVANRVLNDVGWIAWPACSRKLGLR